MDNEDTKKFDFDNANLADQITVIGELEHLYMHALKTASTLGEEEGFFYMTLAHMTKELRRRFMREHFPDVREEDWCILKAADTIRQRIYECANTSHKDLEEVNNLWALVMEHIFGVDLSACIACKEDKRGSHEDSLE